MENKVRPLIGHFKRIHRINNMFSYVNAKKRIAKYVLRNVRRLRQGNARSKWCLDYLHNSLAETSPHPETTARCLIPILATRRRYWKCRHLRLQCSQRKPSQIMRARILCHTLQSSIYGATARSLPICIALSAPLASIRRPMHHSAPRFREGGC